MPDYGSKVADKAISETAKKIRKIYSQAGKELEKKFEQFQQRHAAKGQEMLDKLKNGEITQAEYHRWMRGQVFIGKQWDAKIDQAAKIMANANKTAANIVRTGKFGVFAENYNHAAYELEKRVNGNLNFNLYNTDTVARLVKKNPKMLPEWKIDEPKDYRWNRKKVENCITQGIIQGEGIDQITERMVGALVTQNENKMRTFSRTAMTGAQNAGRLHQMEDAEEEGIKVKKRWVATLDNRTRDTHQELDGQEVPIDEPFEVDGMEIMYPGDPNAAPELVYNCRCAMIEVYEGIDRKTVRRAYDEDENGERDTANSYTVEDMTYKEWKEWKENGKQPVRAAEHTEEPTVVNNTSRIEQKGQELGTEKEKLEAISEYSSLGEEETKEIAGALFGYDDDPEHCYFDGADSEIRSRATEAASRKADAIQGYIDASPKAEGKIYRGMAVPKETLDTLQVGTEFDEQGYAISSWSSREDVGQRFASSSRNKYGGEMVVFEYSNPKHGTPVAHLSPTPVEQEVLVNNARVRYRVVGREEYIKESKALGARKFVRIILEEIEE